MSDVENRNFDKKLAFHTAPTLLGIKCASLISLSLNEFDIDIHSEKFNRKAVSKGLKSKILCSCNKRALLLIYSEKLLKIRLCDHQIQKLLKECGYNNCIDTEDYLDILSHRIKESSSFPHEIGIFLGYPLEDVLGFIENKGNNYKISGYWKVYGCEEQAKRMFLNFEKCRNFLCNKLNEGADIYQALKIS